MPINVKYLSDLLHADLTKCVQDGVIVVNEKTEELLCFFASQADDACLTGYRDRTSFIVKRVDDWATCRMADLEMDGMI